jgi:ApaG protein
MVPYEATTESITVIVRPVFLDQPSDFVGGRFVFGYLVRIQNDGLEEVQLLRRHWYIGDETGRVREVEGEGVIGEKPVIGPGAFHEYSSYCVLSSFEGWMEGTYLMERASGERFRAVIPRFDLRAGAN